MKMDKTHNITLFQIYFIQEKSLSLLYRDRLKKANIFSIVISKLYLAENELYEFIAQYKNISVEEAKKVNVIELIKEIFKTEGAADFLA